MRTNYAKMHRPPFAQKLRDRRIAAGLRQKDIIARLRDKYPEQQWSQSKLVRLESGRQRSLAKSDLEAFYDVTEVER